jgi:hypothetical protein
MVLEGQVRHEQAQSSQVHLPCAESLDKSRQATSCPCDQDAAVRGIF